MSGTPLQSVKAWNFTPVTPGFGNAYFHVWHHAKLLNYFNHLFFEEHVYFTIYMIVYIQFAEYDLSYSPSSPMFFLDAVVADRRRVWTSGWEAT
jgi:hypothetical protein